jgi:hypothetical protein
LASDATADQPGIALLNYIDILEPGAAAKQLQTRRDKVAIRHAELANVPDDVRYLHPALDLGLRQVEVELDWLDSKLDELRKRTTTAA